MTKIPRFLIFLVFALSEIALASAHFGFYGSSGYIGAWHLSDDIYISEVNDQFENDDGSETKSHRIQYISGVQGIKGINISLGAATAYDLNSWLSFHGNLYLSCRYRKINTTEHHYKISETFDEDAIISQDTSYDSYGTYNISLKYWHLDLPLTIRLNLPKSFFIEAGGFFSYIAAANLKLSLISLNMSSYSAGIELGTLAGFGHTFTIKQRNLDIFGKFTLGLTPLFNDKVKKYICQDVRPREWGIEIGAIFWLF